MAVTGAVVWRGNTTVPSGYLYCDGAAVSRTTYSALFGVIGTTYGAGDGSTTFNVPNLIDHYPLGANSGAGVSRGAAGGTKDHTHSGASHTHSVTQPDAHSDHLSAGGHPHDAHTTSALIAQSSTSVSVTAPTTHSTQGGHTHDAHSAHASSATQAATGTTGTAEPPYVELKPVIKT